MIAAEQLGHADARLFFKATGHLYPGAQAARALAAFLLDSAVGQAWGE
jgi:hypothetical protein